MRRWTLVLSLVAGLAGGMALVVSLPSAAGMAAWPGGERPLDAIDICSQHAPKCPLDEAGWPGAPGEWQYTGKRWTRHSGTPADRTIIWEWSRPYTGTNPAFLGQRENHYSDFSGLPGASPVFTGTGPLTYDWERWEPTTGNFIFHQYGRATEQESMSIGEADCDSGVFYPVIDHTVDHAYTPMAATREGECALGGYISTHRLELWGEPLSQIRVDKCDDPLGGVPASESERGNAICKLSPHVGTVNQRYVLGPTASLLPNLGCETVIYAWGWEYPQAPTSGQDFETWFRNGELRFSRWINLSDQITSTIPAPDDHAWWDGRCEVAWTGTSNVVYSGIFKIGSQVYTDAITLPTIVTATIPASGGYLTSTLDHTYYYFPPGTFTATVVLTHSILPSAPLGLPDNLLGIGHFYGITGVYSANSQVAVPLLPYTTTIQYSAEELGVAAEDTLAFYYLAGHEWQLEPSSFVLAEENRIKATPLLFSEWAVLGETRHIYLPLINKS